MRAIWVCIGFAPLHSMIGYKILCSLLNQSSTNLKPIKAWSLICLLGHFLISSWRYTFFRFYDIWWKSVLYVFPCWFLQSLLHVLSAFWLSAFRGANKKSNMNLKLALNKIFNFSELYKELLILSSECAKHFFRF